VILFWLVVGVAGFFFLFLSFFVLVFELCFAGDAVRGERQCVSECRVVSVEKKTS